MTYPLYALAGCTILIGFLCLVSGLFGGGTAEWFGHHLHATLGFESLGHEEHHFDWLIALTGTVAGVLGLALAYLMYAEPSPIPGQLSQRLAPSTRHRCTSSGSTSSTSGCLSGQRAHWRSYASFLIRIWWIGWCEASR